jgi:hypothetical protein
MTSPSTPDEVRLRELAEAWVKAQERYTACWMDADRDRCRRMIDSHDADLKAAEGAFRAKLAALSTTAAQAEARYADLLKRAADLLQLWSDENGKRVQTGLKDSWTLVLIDELRAAAIIAQTTGEVTDG